MAASAACTSNLCATPAPFQRIIYAGSKKESKPLERFATTLCRQCPGGCGLRVRMVNDSVVGIAGNPLHPINHGGVCARAPAALQTLYNPDRLTKPMLLAGPKGAGRYRPIEWDEAIERLATKLKTIRRDPGPQSLVVVINGDRGLTRLLWSRFLQAYGSNNLIDWSFPEGHVAYPAVWATQGLRRAVGYDLARAKYVLSFGSQWLDAHWSPAHASEIFASLRGQGEAVRARFIHVEPRLSLTGAKADEWIPVRPGTEGALALGLAHVILREGLYDRDFVENFTHGFEDPAGGTGERIGYRRLVLRDYAPSKVANITGVHEATIFRLAREFASNAPALAIGFDGSGAATQRCYDRMAIHSLNALVGSIDVPGGVTCFQDLEILNLPAPDPDETAERGLSRPRFENADRATYPLGANAPHILAEHVLAELPYPNEVMVLGDVDIVFTSPHPERVRQALAKIPFVVSLSPWLNETASFADLIIPERHFLTRWDVDVGHTLTGQPAVTIGQPVIDWPQEGLASADLILELARRLGGTLPAALPFKDAEAVVRTVFKHLHASNRGGPFSSREEEGWTRLLEGAGWRFQMTGGEEDFFRQALQSGGWTDPIYYHREWDRVFRAPPRRFAFHSTVIAESLKPGSIEDDIRCLPHYEPVHSEPSDETFPLSLYVYPLPSLAGMTDANVPWLMDTFGRNKQERWRNWVEINPVTGEQLGIKDGDEVVVESRRGRIRTRVKLFQGVMPGVVAFPWGLGHQKGGRWCEGVGQNPSELVEAYTDPLTSEQFWNANRVSMKKA
ncbi:MAG: molybdopterin-dependent oxidoreductase [Planctomycetes bacterium]|nr:molybdopterin-dependent oxidoreductase [Planctomycetota bacterium]